MEMLKRNFEKVLLAIALLVVLGTAVFLFARADKIKKQLGILPAEKRQSDIARIERVTFDPLFDQLKAPFQWRSVSHRLFNPNPMILTREGVKPWKAPPLDPMRAWESRYGMDQIGTDPELDPDNDGFTNREEYVCGTDPTDPKSRPSMAVKLRAARVYEKRIGVQFVGTVIMTKGEAPVLWFKLSDGRAVYIHAGEMAESYKVLEAVRDDKGEIVAVTIQREGEQPITLKLKEEAGDVEPVADLVFPPTGQRWEGRRNEKITLSGEQFTIKNIDIKTGKVIILSPTGETYEFQQQALPNEEQPRPTPERHDRPELFLQ
jgi:hypothetical protein